MKTLNQAIKAAIKKANKILSISQKQKSDINYLQMKKRKEHLKKRKEKKYQRD